MTTVNAPELADEVVLDAALEAFAANGFGGTSVRELTRDLGVSHNFVHQRFGSKDRLWFAAIDHGFARLAADLAATRFGPDDDDLDRLRATAVRYVQSMAGRPALLRIISSEGSTPGPRVDHLYDRYIEPVCQFLRPLLDRLTTEGRLRPIDVTTLYFMLTNGAAGPAALPALGARFGDLARADDPDHADPDPRRAHAVATVDLVFDGLTVS